MKVDKWLIAKVLSSALALSVIFIGLDAMRREVPPPPELVWCLALIFIGEGWGALSDMIREAELEYREKKKREKYFSEYYKKLKKTPIVWDEAGYWLEPMWARRWNYWLSRLDGLRSWEYVKEWFYEI